MPIEFRCSNVAGFDEKSQSYVVCNQKLRVKSDRAGGTINCPKCNQELEVPLPDLVVPEPGSQVAATDDLAGIQQKPGVMELEFDAGVDPDSSPAFSNFENRCPQCGGKFNRDSVCRSCGYVEPSKHAEKKAAANTPIKPSGFQLWLGSIANEGVSLPIIGYVLFAATVLFCLLTISWGILSTSIPGVLAAVMAAFLLCFATAVMLKTRDLATNNDATLGILSPAWNWMLIAARALEWEKYDGKLKNRKILDLRNKDIGDEELRQQKGLQSCEVLDLENCPITDAGLPPLYRIASLKCLVLKNTEVSQEAVFKLQQYKPHLWIWQ